MSQTRMRVPLTQGLPPQTPGLLSMCSVTMALFMSGLYFTGSAVNNAGCSGSCSEQKPAYNHRNGRLHGERGTWPPVRAHVSARFRVFRRLYAGTDFCPGMADAAAPRPPLRLAHALSRTALGPGADGMAGHGRLGAAR